MLALQVCICDQCGKVYNYDKKFNSINICIYCIMRSDYHKPLTDDQLKIAKNKKLLDVILAPAKTMIDEYFDDRDEYKELCNDK